MESSGIRLLMIEDMAEEAELASVQLRRAGIEHVLRRVDSEDELTAALDEFDPSVILSDFSLPRYDGMSALRLCSQQRPEIPFIFFSGTIGEERAIEALKSGATDYVLKGNARRLASAVTRAIDQRVERAGRRRAERMLRESEERFRSIVETSADWIWEIDESGRHVFCNPCVETILGFPRRELLGAPHGAHLHPDDQARFAQVLVETAQRRTGWKGLVLRWRDCQGSTRWLESNAVCVQDEQGRLTGFRGVDRDITDRRRDDERIRRLSRVHAMLSNTNSTIVRVRDRRELLREACRIAVVHGQYAVAWAGVVEQGLDALVRTACSGSHCELFGDGPFPLTLGARGAESVLLRALHTRQPVIIDRTHNEGPATLKRELSRLNLDCLIALPLLVGEEALGVFALAGSSAQLFDEGEIKLLQELAGDLAFALEYIRQEAHLHYLANYDTLTGLPNRDLTLVRLQEFIDAAAPGASKAVAVFDVDRLSEINHTFGRHRGDQLLRQAAARLRSQLPEGVRTGYCGGGVFVVIFPALMSDDEAYRVQEWFDRNVTAEPFHVEGQELRIVGHLGVALHPADGSDAATLLGNAEIALRNAKSAGDRIVYSSPEHNERVARRLSLENRLRRAYEREEFRLVLQPKVEIETNRISGFEALLRLDGDDGADIPPSVFVPVLEETGLIEPVGEWVLACASELVRQWSSKGRSTRIAVNVCARQLGRPDFARQLRAVLESGNGANPGLDLEITESAVLANLDLAVRVLEEARALGLHIALDDFGTGYSSLSQLVRLPIDVLKIDRSFVAAMNEDENVATVVATITSLARSLDLGTVAEGVENAEQLARLRELGCREYQGHLFGPELAPKAAFRLLAS